VTRGGGRRRVRVPPALMLARSYVAAQEQGSVLKKAQSLGGVVFTLRYEAMQRDLQAAPALPARARAKRAVCLLLPPCAFRARWRRCCGRWARHRCRANGVGSARRL
jgi:hypothetical protein